ncbi:phage integrase N-terminal domain-containing protein [Halodesulfovibrio sp. MK-HDV]|uniref:phage integrase N-terminal domain-containing protein n=1 Tax=Halodesulfovibrio sp. MK-HDV TaxID=2599925 RepID=UPI00136A84B9|nr:phage integrase N-terminal domain-containing protein [Halodesulfovibrio sp. MK-HDV]KAF1077349.1 Tyrosine recombinase XerC [Halodesulfovibrio sp. MK-HDV]
MSKNRLLYGAKTAHLTGSGKTKYNNRGQSMRFSKRLHQLGYRVQHWKNISNRHVAVVVEDWQQQGLAVSTIKSYLSSVRQVCRVYGNDRIHKKNSEFGVGNRNYIPQQTKAVPEVVCRAVADQLLSGAEKFQRIGHQINVMRALGLRPEEARKINPRTALLPDGRIYISAGTKGGRDRILHEPSKEQIGAVKALTPFIGKNGNSWPDSISEASWEKYVYKVISRMGLCLKVCGASLHGLRHAYAQSRYKELTKLAAPCLYPSPADYRQAAYQAHGEDWRTTHDQAINILAHELGHNRGEVTATYLGTIHG